MSKNTKIFFLSSLFVLMAVVLVLPQIGSAQASLGLDTGAATGLGTRDLKELIVSIVRIVLGFLGIISVIILMYGGFVWMMAKGEPEKIDKGKKIVVAMVIGLVIILSAYLIVSYVLKAIQGATGGGQPGGDEQGGGGFGLNEESFRVVSIAPLGNLPYRNVPLQITFNQSVDEDSLTPGAMLVQHSDGNGGMAEVAGLLSVNGQDGRSVLFTPEAACPEPNAGERCFDYSPDNAEINRHYVALNLNDDAVFRSRSGLVLTCVADECQGEFVTGAGISERPLYCFNGIFDEELGETAIDCGGSCGACDGAACSSSELACEPANNLCASNLCSDQCVCVSAPVATAIDPDNGARGNWVTVYGRDFGDEPGRVMFDDVRASLPEAEQCADSWSDRQIIVVVPENLELGVHQVKVITSGNLESNILDFDVNETVRPGVCLADPNEGAFENAFTVYGNQFGNGENERDVLFGNAVSGRNLEWSERSVAGTVPNIQAGNSAVKVRVRNENSNSLRFTVLESAEAETIINYFTPSTGGEGQYITIFGRGFGQYQAGESQVKFSTDKLGSFAFPNECGNNFWTDHRIIVKAPSQEAVGNIDDGPITVITAGGRTAVSRENFDFNAELQPTPGLCSLNPEAVRPGGSFEAAGEGFEGSSLFLNNAMLDDSPDNNNFFGDVAVPDNAQTGPVTARKDGQTSNAIDLEIARRQGALLEDQGNYYQWQFTTCLNCQTPRVVIRQSCGNGAVASPLPMPASTDNFGNGLISATFNVNMTEEDFGLNRTVLLRQCGNGNAPANCQPVQAAGDFAFYPAEDDSEFYFTLDLNNDLEASTWYQVILDGSLRSDRLLDNEHEQIPMGHHFGNGAFGSADGWYFKTRSAENLACSGNSVAVNPRDRRIVSGRPVYAGDTVNYSSALYNSENCNLCANDYEWNWHATQPDKAVLTPDNLDPNPADNRKTMSAQGITEGPAIITALAVSAPGQPRGVGLVDIIEGDPHVVMQNECRANPPASPTPYPNYQEACVNALPTVKFDKLMLAGRLNVDNVKLFSCDNGGCSNEAPLERIALISGMIGGQNGVIGATLIPRQNLSANADYQISLRNIVSATYRPLSGLSSWNFKTKNSSEACAFTSIFIDPTEHRFDAAGQTENYTASGQGESCQVLRPAQGLEWSWRSEDDGIAAIQSSNANESVVADTENEGRTFIRAAAADLQNQGNNGQVVSDFTPQPLVLRIEQVRPTGDNACLNALGQIYANMPFNPASVSGQNIKIYKQDNNQWIEIESRLSLAFNNSVINILPATEDNFWDPSAEYAISALGGENGIRAASGEVLTQAGCANQPLTWTAQNNSCQWIFATGQEHCAVASLLVEPRMARTNVGSVAEFMGTPLAENNNALSNRIDNWQSLSQAVAVVDSVSEDARTASLAGVGVGESTVLGTLPDRPGSQNVIRGTAVLRVEEEQTGPSVTEAKPEGDNVCRNSSVSLAFDKMLDGDTVNGNNFFLQYKKEFAAPEDVPNGCVFIRQQDSFNIGSAFVAKFFNYLVGKIYDLAFNLLSGKASADMYWCPITGAWATENSDGRTLVDFRLNDLLPDSKDIRATVKGGASGVKATNGLPLTGELDNQGNFVHQFHTAATRCDVNFVSVITDEENQATSWTFNTAIDNQTDNEPGADFDSALDSDKQFGAHAYSAQGEELRSIADVYEWTWQWSSSDETVSVIRSSEEDKAIVEGQNKNGRNFISASTVFPAGYGLPSKTGSALVEVDLCVNRWSPQQNTYGYLNQDFSFGLNYCLDYGGEGVEDDLPDLLEPRASELPGTQPKVDFFLKEYLMPVPATGDVIGVRVYSNVNHYSPAMWYQKNVNVQGSPQRFLVDGYEAIKDGRSVYVSASKAQPIRGYVGRAKPRFGPLAFINRVARLIKQNIFDQVFAAANNPNLPGTDAGAADFDNAPQAGNNNGDLMLFDQGLGQGLNQDAAKINNGQPAGNNNNELIKFEQGFNDQNAYQRFDSDVVGLFWPARVTEVGSAYTNIYLVSYNQDADPKTAEIVNRLLNGMEFNVNIDNWQIRDQLRRDIKRLADLADISDRLANYKRANNDKYPELASGSYLSGISTSKWPSWQQTLAGQIGSLPVDPINNFNACAQCDDQAGNCGYDRQTCWNPTANNNAGAFACDAESYLYLYRAFTRPNGQVDYTLAAKLEATADWLPADRLNSHWAISKERVLDNRAPRFFGCSNEVFGSFCGDGVVKGDEQCEPGMFKNWCPQGYAWYNPVMAGCGLPGAPNECQWVNPFAVGGDYAGYSVVQACGGYCGDQNLNTEANHYARTDEQCDVSVSPASDGFGGGAEQTDQYLCSGSCTDTGGWCGDNRVQANFGEVCDLNSGLNSWSCTDPNGRPQCANNCGRVSCTAGIAYQGQCGNNVVEAPEACDTLRTRPNTICSNFCLSMECRANFKNCNGDNQEIGDNPDGCEINTYSDRNNCGSCGNECDFHEQCVSGLCRPAGGGGDNRE